MPGLAGTSRMTEGQLVEELFRHDPLCLLLPRGRIACRERRCLRPVGRLELAGVLSERVDHHLVDDRLNSCPVLGRVIHEHPRDADRDPGVEPKGRGDPVRHRTVPTCWREQIQPRLRAVHRPELDERIGPLIDDLVHPEPTLEVRHLNNRWPGGRVDGAEAVDDILIRARDQHSSGVM